MKPISVTQLNNQIKSIIESHFEIVLVEGEVSKAVYHSSGHLYFTIKDENSSINCAMWKSNLSKLKFKIKPGEKILVYGAISLYVPRGEYKLIAQSIEPSGIGALQLAYEQLKEELSKLGYFDEERKKPLPKFPKKIAIVTSSTAAALADMLRVANKRWRLTKFYLFNTLVQGENAAEDIARKIKMADNYVFEDGNGFDLIIVGRGGGSKEDLWPFNERAVADAIFEAKTPVISAVGHEIDYLISDFVADKRAATPSNAIEIALPDGNEILMYIDEMINAINYKMQNILSKKEKNLLHLFEIFKANSINKKLLMKVTEESLYKGIEVAVANNRIGDIGAAVQQYVESFGFSVVRDLCGHGVGRKLHEDPQIPNYGKKGTGAKIKNGMTIAIEPMINIGTHKVTVADDGWTVITADKMPSAHFEHSIAIIDGKPEILSVS